MESLRVDALIVGAGPGGYVAGIRLGQLGKKALVVERDKAGGVCLNVGCIPSKALINAAKLYEKIAHGADLGILADNPRVDMAKLQSWKDGVVGKLSAGVRQLLKANGCDWRSGSARLLSPGRVEIQGTGPDAGKTVLVEAAHIVLATGARPMQIPGFAFDGNRVLDSTGALAFTEVPRRLVVIGAGYIGMEIGTLYAKLGSRVVFVEALPTILSGSEPDCVQVVARKAKQLGMEIIVNAKASGWTEMGDHAMVTVATRPASGSSTPTRSWSRWAANQTATGWAWRRPGCRWNAASSRWTASCAPTCPASTPSATWWGSPISRTRLRARPKWLPRSLRAVPPRWMRRSSRRWCSPIRRSRPPASRPPRLKSSEAGRSRWASFPCWRSAAPWPTTTARDS